MAFALNVRGQPPITVNYKGKTWTIPKVDFFVLRVANIYYMLDDKQRKLYAKGKLDIKFPIYEGWSFGKTYKGILVYCGTVFISTSSASARRDNYHSPLETLCWFLKNKKQNTTITEIETAIKAAIKKGDFKKLRKRYCIVLGCCSDSNLQRRKTSETSKWVFFNPDNFGLPPLFEGQEESW